MSDDARARALLDVWFEDAIRDPGAAQARNRRWFQSDAAFDGLLRARFGDLPSRLRMGEFDAWRGEPQAALARIVALDQIPRNVFRGTAAAFAFDAVARAAALEAIDRGFDLELHPLQAVFVYLPLEHAEDEGLQTRSVELFDRLRARAPAALGDLFESYFDYARRHAEVIDRFGRFPHRNDALGRAATAAEDAYLAGGGQRF